MKPVYLQSGIIVTFVLTIIILECSYVYSVSYSVNNTRVQTKYGPVKGVLLRSRIGRSFYGFKGIPYAKPPIGKLRFKAPESPDPWNTVIDATEDAPFCIQKNYLFNEHPPVEGKEDCLYLNVYTPKLPTTSHNQAKWLLPVMVYIHYGGYFAGSGNSDYIGPEYFMDKNVILVTFNYRVGVFGFLSTNDDASPGNWALKDQVKALEWVQSSIAAFGGDNKKVTIFGQSAGAGSVHYHLLSPTTAGLFRSAISQSGSTLCLWARPHNDLQALIAKQQASFVGCDANSDSNTMVECLRSVDAEILADSSDLFKFFSSEPFVIYGPVTEKETPLNKNPYITEDPLDLIEAGKFHKVPWITGVVADEGILRAAPLLRKSSIHRVLNKNFNQYGPQILGVPLSVNPTDVPDVWKRITNYFLGADSVNVTHNRSVQGFIDLYSDRSFNYGAYQSAILHVTRGHKPVWFYNFAYRGEYSYGDHFAATTENIEFNWGVSHCDDLIYLFPSQRLFKRLVSTNDVRMSKIMIQLWTNFAKYGNPTPPHEISLHPWIPISYTDDSSTIKNSDFIYLNITGPHEFDNDAPIKLEMSNSFNTERMKFWANLPLKENINTIE